MVRPRKCRSIDFIPSVRYFKPQGVSLSSLKKEQLRLDEVEALRLSEIEGLSQAEAAEKMSVHQSTFHRILLGARQKLARAIIEGRAIELEGDDNMPNGDGTGPEGKGPMTGRRQGRCKDSDAEVPPRRGLGKGLGGGRGLGRGQVSGRGQGLGRGRGRGRGLNTNN